MEAISLRWRGIYTPSSRCSYKDDVQSMAWGVLFDFHTGRRQDVKSQMASSSDACLTGGTTIHIILDRAMYDGMLLTAAVS